VIAGAAQDLPALVAAAQEQGAWRGCACIVGCWEGPAYSEDSEVPAGVLCVCMCYVRSEERLWLLHTAQLQVWNDALGLG